MKLPIIESLKSVRGNRVPVYPTSRLKITKEAEQIGPASSGYGVGIDTTVSWSMTQVVLDGEDAISKAHEQAVLACAREIYGPIVEELQDIQEHIWSANILDEELERRVSELIANLRGEA